MTTLPLFLTASLSMGEKMALSGEMILRGMGTVFLVLIILWGIIALFGKLASSGSKPKEKPANPAPKAEEKKSEPAVVVKEEAPAPVQTVQQDDNSIIAAIIAAVEAYRAEEGLSGLPYRVVSFKRKSGKKSWNGSIED